MHVHEEFEHSGKIIRIVHDDDPENPRDLYDNLGLMCCFHRNYQLGDAHDLNMDDFRSWNEVLDYLKEEEEAKIYSPLYLFDHSGLVMSTEPFGCSWDSGQVGWVYTTDKRISSCGIADLTEERVKAIFQVEAETYSKFINGELMGYRIYAKCSECDHTTEYLDSCSGFEDIDECREEAKAAAEAI